MITELCIYWRTTLSVLDFQPFHIFKIVINFDGTGDYFALFYYALVIDRNLYTYPFKYLEIEYTSS